MTTARTASAERLAVEAWRRIRQLGRDPEVVAAHHRLIHETGLSVGPLRALRALRLDSPEPMRNLAARMGCDNSYVTLLVDALEERGLAHREVHPSDRRVKVIVLTDEGRAMAERVRAVDDVAPAALGGLTRSELRVLCDLLRKLEPGDSQLA